LICSECFALPPARLPVDRRAYRDPFGATFPFSVDRARTNGTNETGERATRDRATQSDEKEQQKKCPKRHKMTAEDDDRWDDDDGWDDDDDGGDDENDQDDDIDDDEGWDDAGGDGFDDDDDGFKDGWNDEGVARALRAVEATVSNDDECHGDSARHPCVSFDDDIDRCGTTTTTTTTKQMTFDDVEAEDALKATLTPARPRYDSDSDADPDRDAEDELLMAKPSFFVQEEARRASAEAEARKEKEGTGAASVRLETPTTAAEDVELEDAFTEDDGETFGAFRQADANRFNPFAKENVGRTGGNASVRDDYEEDDWEDDEEAPRRDAPPASRNVSRMAMLPTTSVKTSAPWRARLPHFVPVDELPPQSFHEGEIVHIDYCAQFGGPKSAVAASFARPATAAELGRTSRGTAAKKTTTATHQTRWFTDENGVKTFVDVDGSRKTGKAAYKAAQLAARPKEW
jgi:hypothetical protein